MRARIILGLDPLPGHGHNIDPREYGLDKIRRRRRREIELAPQRSRQHRQVLRNGQRDVEAVLLKEALLLGDPCREPRDDRNIRGPHRRQLRGGGGCDGPRTDT